MLSKESIVKFKEIYKKIYNKEISDQEAFEIGTNLLNLYKFLLKNKSNRR